MINGWLIIIGFGFTTLSRLLHDYLSYPRWARTRLPRENPQQWETWWLRKKRSYLLGHRVTIGEILLKSKAIKKKKKNRTTCKVIFTGAIWWMLLYTNYMCEACVSNQHQTSLFPFSKIQKFSRLFVTRPTC